jgi:two-component system, sensor histidine kinase and response regulator
MILKMKRVAPVLDMQVISDLRSIHTAEEGDVLNTLANVFLAANTERLAVLSQAANAGNLEVVKKTAHTMKSSAGLIGAMKLRDVILELEDSADEGNTDAVSKLILEAHFEFEKALKELKKVTH